MLISVTNLDGQTEPLNNFQRLEIIEEVNGAYSLAVTSFFHPSNPGRNPGHVLLEEESVINVDGYDFRVKQMREANGRKEVVALSTFFDLIGHQRKLIYGGTRTFDEFATFVFGGTGWTFSNIDVSGSRLMLNFGEGNVIKLVQALCAAFECEYKIMPNKHVQFAKRVGPDNDAQYRYGHNVKTLSKSVDTTNLRTKITGYGGGGLVVTYTSPDAEKFPDAGEAEPVHDDRFTIADNLAEYIKRKLIDYPETSIELDSVELSDKDIGERVWLIYEPLNVEFQTRVMKKTSTIRNEKLVTLSVVIGNTIPRTLSDILSSTNIQIDENAKQTRSRIEQTNEMIELAVERFAGEILEAYAFIKITADEIRSEVGAMDVRLSNGIAQNKSSISQTAAQIRLEVSQEIKRVDGSLASLSSSITQTAESIRSEVNKSVTDIDGKITSANSSITQLSDQIISVVNTSIPGLDGRINTAESEIRQQANQITSKVSQSDYNGNVLTSLINQTASSVRIQAKNIEMEGIVRVSDSVELGHSGNGKTKAIKFNGTDAWIYSGGDFSLSLDASRVRVLGDLVARSPSFGSAMPVITGTSSNQALSIGLTPGGVLNIYRANGSSVSFSPD